MTAHCSRCGLEVELDIVLEGVPEVVLCSGCKASDVSAPDTGGEGELGVEIVEAGTDEFVLGIDVSF